MNQLATHDSHAIAAMVTALRAGGVVAAPTETVYGLMTRWGNDAGRERIYQLKRRSADKLLQMLAADLDMAVEAGVVREARLEQLAARFWPGPLTVVCAAAGGGSVGLRIPQHPFILAVLRELGEPLAATSANRSGEPPAAAAAAAVAGLDGEPDLLVDGGPVGTGAASTVVSILEPEVRLLRSGAITREAITAALQAAVPAPVPPARPRCPGTVRHPRLAGRDLRDA